jgi:hypothetical protein
MAAADTSAADGGSDSAGRQLAAAPRYRRLRQWNAVMAVLHVVQGALMVAMAETVRWPITRRQYEFDAATETIAPRPSSGWRSPSR